MGVDIKKTDLYVSRKDIFCFDGITILSQGPIPKPKTEQLNRNRRFSKKIVDFPVITVVASIFLRLYLVLLKIILLCYAFIV